MKTRSKKSVKALQRSFCFVVGVFTVIVVLLLIAFRSKDDELKKFSLVSDTVYGNLDYTYPCNTMSFDFGNEVYEQGFKYYEIPDAYVRSGGYFPEAVQVYLWDLCRDRGLDYCMVIAMIEQESGYRYDAIGDGGESVGYLQIGERWHKARMEAEGVTDLSNPYGNIRVGLNFLQEFCTKYLDSSGIHCVLMAYSMGENGAKNCWEKGIYSTEYSRSILFRAEEIRILYR